MMNVKEIMQCLPHRYPFLLVDRVLELEPYKRIVAMKNVTMNEEFFQGHFPGNPIMPGVLLIEALAQVGGVLAVRSVKADNMMTYFMAIEKAKFRKPVVPGDQLRLEVEITQQRRTVWKLSGKAFVGDDLVCESDFTAMTTEKEIG